MKLYDALKTRRKIRQGNIGDFIDPPLICGFSIQKVMDDSWETEPEVYEVECTWINCGYGGCKGYAVPLKNNISGRPLEKLIGKRTKLTIEVLD